MLRQWLAPETVPSFVATHLRRQPFARADVARDAAAAFQWDTLATMLAADARLDLLSTMRGRLVDVPRPRDLDEVRQRMANGVSTVIRRAERNDPGLTALAAAFAHDLPSTVQVQLYVTPAGTNSFGWHWDVEDVFIVQTAGAKDYYFRPNTVDPTRPASERPDFALVRRETSPIATARLLPGDWLYVPSRWWHVVTCAEDALSISLGVYPDERVLRDVASAATTNATCGAASTR